MTLPPASGLRFQTDADRERVIEGLATGDRKADQVLDRTVHQLAKRWFVLHDMHKRAPRPCSCNRVTP